MITTIQRMSFKDYIDQKGSELIKWGLLIYLGTKMKIWKEDNMPKIKTEKLVLITKRVP